MLLTGIWGCNNEHEVTHDHHHMEDEYLTIPEAMKFTGKSDSTIRRWIRLVRDGYHVSLTDTIEELETKTSFLRKKNVRKNRRGVQEFDWLLSKSALGKHFERTVISNNSPTDDPDQSHAMTSVAATRGDAQSTGSDLHTEPQPTLGDPQLSGDPSREDPRVKHAVSHDDVQQQPEDNHSDQMTSRDTLNALMAPLDQKDKQIEQLHGLFDNAQKLLSQAQKKIPELSAPPSSVTPSNGGDAEEVRVGIVREDDSGDFP